MQIYKITNSINGKSYIGKDEKNCPSYFGSGLIIKQAIKKYGIENFKKEILEECEDSIILCEKEKFWIKEMNSLSPIGYNISPGGNGGDVRSHHPNKKESIKKFQLKMFGRKVSEETKQKISIGNKKVNPIIRKISGKKAAETKRNRINEIGFTSKEIEAHKLNSQKLSIFNKSEIGRKAVSKALKGKKKLAFSEEHRKNIGKSSLGRNIPGKQISINNIIFDSLHEASRVLNIPIMTIRNRLIRNSFPNWYYLNKNL